MNEAGLAKLTHKEKEALRLVVTHRSTVAIASELGISDSAVKLRLGSAARKLDAPNRFEAGRLLASHEGWLPYTFGTGSNRQVGAAPDSMLDPNVNGAEPMEEHTEPGVLREERLVYQAPTPPPALLRWLLRTGSRNGNDLGLLETLAGILMVAVLVALALAALVWSYSQLDRLTVNKPRLPQYSTMH